MRRNTSGLKKSARLRSEQAMERAPAALHRMNASDRDINFRTVASEAKVSTAWLYGQEKLRIRIMRSRKRRVAWLLPRPPLKIASVSPDRTSWQHFGFV